MAAVKIIPKSFLYSRFDSLDTADEEAERFELALQRETVIMKLIDHPNIMKLHDVYDTTNHLYLILEHVQGGELFDYLCDQGQLSSSEALRYFQQIIAAVDYLHRFNIVHRDLKPENILLDSERNVKLADFGMAAWQPDRLLQTSCGSPHYAAPEVVSGLQYDGAVSDIWSCGVILFAMLAGRLPFDEEDCLELLEKVRIGKFDMPEELDPSAQDLISKMLTKDVTKRITMSDIRQHPFFQSYSPKPIESPPVTLYDFASPLDSHAQIDAELLRHLHALWPNDSDEEISAHLLNDERNWQKGIYQLLAAYRQKTLEAVDEAEEMAEVERTRRKQAKAKARAAILDPQPILDSTVSPSPSSFPPRVSPPTPRRAARRDRYSTASSEESLFFHGDETHPRIALHSPSDSERSSLHRTPEPTPLIVPQHQDVYVQSFFKEVADHINVLYSRTEGVHSPVGALSPNLALMHEIVGDRGLHVVMPDASASRDVYPLSSGAHNEVKPLTVTRREKPRRPTILSDKENMDDGFLVVERDDVFRDGRVKIVKPKDRGKLKKLRNSSPSSEAGSPERSSSPKKKWLAHVFRFKSSRFTLLSTHDVQTSQNECRRLLMASDVRVAIEHDGDLRVLRCKREETKDTTGLLGDMKAAKFRVEVQVVAQDGVSVTLLYEKGSLDTFKEICKRLRRDWVLDVVGSRTPQQVAYMPAHSTIMVN